MLVMVFSPQAARGADAFHSNQSYLHGDSRESIVTKYHRGGRTRRPSCPLHAQDRPLERPVLTRRAPTPPQVQTLSTNY